MNVYLVLWHKSEMTKRQLCWMSLSLLFSHHAVPLRQALPVPMMCLCRQVPSQRTLPARTARHQAKKLISANDDKSHGDEENDGIDESENEDEEFEEPEDSDYEE